MEVLQKPRKIKALVVDDKKVIGDLFGYILGKGGHDITVVQSGDEALRKIRNEDFDMAFLDIIMPRKDGVTTLKEIKETSPELPVVMMSGYSVESKQKEMQELGAVTCLAKPVRMEDVKEIVKSATGKDI